MKCQQHGISPNSNLKAPHHISVSLGVKSPKSISDKLSYQDVLPGSATEVLDTSGRCQFFSIFILSYPCLKLV